jgi:hypothetical protein
MAEVAMTREEIMLIAEEAGVRLASYSDTVDQRNVYPHELERFAKLIREREREACAKTCEQIANELSNWPAAHDGITAETKFIRGIGETIGKPFVEAIRARGNT